MKELRVSFPKPCSENWDAMTPKGRNRFCARCAKTIHDLSAYSFDEAAPLLQAGEEICVRARLTRAGGVTLRSGSTGKRGRIMLAVAASIGMAALSNPALADKRDPEGTIAGTVVMGWRTLVTVTGPDGRQYTAQSKINGRYKIKHLPPGPYKIDFLEDGETRWNGGEIIVVDRKTVKHQTTNPNPPIIIGVITVERNGG